MTGVRDEKAAAYGDQVCQFVRYATRREKAGIRKELTDHIADHTQALTSAGHPQETAQALALAAMGDPEEVGRALDREYPLKWRVLAHTSLLLLVVAVPLVLLLLARPGLALKNNLQARWFPMTTISAMEPMEYTVERPAPVPIDLQETLADSIHWKVFGYRIYAGQEVEGYCLSLYAVIYSDDPFTALDQISYVFSPIFTALDPEGAPLPAMADLSCDRTWGAMLFNYSLSGLPYGAAVTAHYDRFGVTFDLPIPLAWEEVDQP